MQPIQPGSAPQKQSNVVVIVVVIVVAFVLMIGAGILLTFMGAGFAAYNLRSRAAIPASASAPSAAPASSPVR